MTNPPYNAGDERGESPLEALAGVIVPTRTGLLYKAGLTLVAFAMVLLPAIYVGLILLVAWGVFYHLTNDTWIVGGGPGLLFRLVGYLGPAAAGGILVFFMVKPLLARQPKAVEPLTLDPMKEPLLFGFVEKICALVRAPMPSRIDVDCQVNASASLRRGLWSRDLVLTIGMPLASGLDMRQFAGVLAHEFGHFAQGAGMRLTYVIRRINLWFARVVYERDRWDVQLDKTAKTADFRVAIVLQAARGCVWLTRRILWALMHAGHAISCFMMRQMEYDADAYEAKLAGSDAFASTAARLPVLNAATEFAYVDVQRSWSNNRLPENLPLLIDHKATALPPDVEREMSAARASARTGWFDTHPCDADRICAARRLNEPGVFRLARPAADLFADFDGLSKIVTRHQYEKLFGLEFADENLMPAEEILRESAANTEAETGVRKFYGSANISLKALLAESDWPPSIDQADVVTTWDEQRKASEELRGPAEMISHAYAEQERRFLDATAVHYLAQARFQVDPEEFGLPEYATSIARQEVTARSLMDQTQAAIATQLADLEPFIGALRQRVKLALRFAQTTASADTLTEIDTLASLLIAVGAEMPRLHEIGAKMRALSLLAQNRDNHPDAAQVDKVISTLAAEIQTQIGGIQGRLEKFPYPFPHARGQLTMAEYAHSEKPAGSEGERVYLESEAHVNRLFDLHFRLLGKLLAHVAVAEETLETSVNRAG
jgi:Zn-dependent protease with chaperone function